MALNTPNMSLPMSYRPKAVTTLIEEEKRECLKLRFSKKYIFIECLKKWYSKLPKKQKSKLTKKTLVRRAVFEAHRLNLPQSSVPLDWMHTLVKQCGLVCYISAAGLRRRQAQKEAEFMADMEETKEKPIVPKIKPLIDLTSKVPPNFWLHPKVGVVPSSRHLALYSDERRTIVYWDYDITHWQLLNPGATRPQPLPT